MHNAWDFVQILYFAGGVRIINENVYYCHIFSYFFTCLGTIPQKKKKIKVILKILIIHYLILF
jgi:hypothetical protein